MQDSQVGSVFRAVRIRRGLTQSQVAAAARVSRSVVSLIERGLFEGTSLRLVRHVADALGISLSLDPRWRGAQLATLLDERHAATVQAVVKRLMAAGWQALPEHTFNVWGERGAMDILAWHPLRRAVLIVEVKTRLVDLQDVLSKLDRKRRLAPAMAKELGWKPLAPGSVLVLPDATWARHAVARFEATFAASLPARTADIRRWLKRPARDLRGIWFLLDDTPGSTKRSAGGSMRVRPRMAMPVAAVARSVDGSVPVKTAGSTGHQGQSPT